MRKNRIEIEKAENGYLISHWDNENEEKQDDYGYVEPDKLVALTEEEVVKVIKEKL